MTLTAKLLATDENIVITKICEIQGEGHIFYISGKYDPRNLISEPLIINFGMNNILKAQKIELDATKLWDVKLHY